MKSGQKLEGNIVERTDKYIKIDPGIGMVMTYYVDEIDTVNGQKFKTVVKTVEESMPNVQPNPVPALKETSTSDSNDICTGTSSAPVIGQTCKGGATYAGTYNGYSYMTTPSGCTDYVNNSTSFSPVCNGATDTVNHAWANNSGTSAFNIVTGASSTTYGGTNTKILLNYTDTDAARYCYYMNYGGYTDWYLPAASLNNDKTGELYNVLYVNEEALGGFQPFYWSSTELNALNARMVNSFMGEQMSDEKTAPIQFPSVRCVRRY